MKNSVVSMGVAAMDEFNSLDQGGQITVLRATAVVYLITLNGIMAIKAERNCYDQEFEAVPPHTPLHLIELSTADFVHLVSKHKKRILHMLGEQELQKITEQHAQLVKVVARSPNVKAALLTDSRHSSFNRVWSALGSDYSSLRMFAAGLASVMPTTSRVEGDFSFINYRKDEYNAALSDFSLEGVLFARQFNDLEAYLHAIP